MSYGISICMYMLLSAVVIMNRCVVRMSVNGRPSAISCSAVRAKLSFRFLNNIGNALSPKIA